MRPVEIFFSYAHEDEKLMDDVRRQLILYDRQGIIEKWHDRKILPGQDWNQVVDARINRARIILLFVSPHFIESKYIYNVEMNEALKLHKQGRAVVIPVILRPCPWQDLPFGHLQALPEDGRAVTQWENRDEVTLSISTEIMRVVKEIISDLP